MYVAHCLKFLDKFLYMFRLTYPTFRGIQRIVSPLQLNPPEDGLFQLKEVGECTLLINKHVLFIRKYSKLELCIINICIMHGIHIIYKRTYIYIFYILSAICTNV